MRSLATATSRRLVHTAFLKSWQQAHHNIQPHQPTYVLGRIKIDMHQFIATKVYFELPMLRHIPVQEMERLYRNGPRSDFQLATGSTISFASSPRRKDGSWWEVTVTRPSKDIPWGIRVVDDPKKDKASGTGTTSSGGGLPVVVMMDEASPRDDFAGYFDALEKPSGVRCLLLTTDHPCEAQDGSELASDDILQRSTKLVFQIPQLLKHHRNAKREKLADELVIKDSEGDSIPLEKDKDTFTQENRVSQNHHHIDKKTKKQVRAASVKICNRNGLLMLSFPKEELLAPQLSTAGGGDGVETLNKSNNTSLLPSFFSEHKWLGAVILLSDLHNSTRSQVMSLTGVATCGGSARLVIRSADATKMRKYPLVNVERDLRHAMLRKRKHFVVYARLFAPGRRSGGTVAVSDKSFLKDLHKP